MGKKAKNAANLAKGPRSVYEKSGEYSCHGCFTKRLEVEKLKEENRFLKEKVKKLERGASVVRVGAHTPSSQIPFKGKTKELGVEKRGGAQVGHQGNGRRKISEESADKVIKVVAPKHCEDCQAELRRHSERRRSILDGVEMRVRKVVYTIERAQCPKCKKLCEPRLPLFRGALFGNTLLAQVAVLHYLQGIPVGRICNMLGPAVNPGSIFTAMHRLAKQWEPAIENLIEEYRKSPVKHADETGWRVDGQPGWSWLFCSPTVSIFECQNTRGSRVPKRIFGDQQLPGVLVVDRFNAYNKLPCQIQYCYAHLVREVKKLDDEFPDDEKVITFSTDLAHFVAEAMRLQSRSLANDAYYKEARQIAGQIKRLANMETDHQGIRSVQRIFVKNEPRLFQWVLDRQFPAHNNRAERELRQTVIARKVSFGSQSENGAKTRSVLMSILATARKRLGEISTENWFKNALDQLALLPEQHPTHLLPPLPP